MTSYELLRKLHTYHHLEKEQWQQLIEGMDEQTVEQAKTFALCCQKKYYGNRIYVRGLIEISSHCKNDCYYCGIRRSNAGLGRYRLYADEILSCARVGYDLGYRTFVLQGGEDGYYTDEILAPLLERLKEKYPDCAITLSLGERSRESYARLKRAGADRYLLRHETADKEHYKKLHPGDMSYEHRIQCLWQMKELGYQVGSGFMVGSPGQTAETLAEDMQFLQQLRPQMVGIGPFIPHRDTPFGGQPPGSVEQTVYLIALIRILLPGALLPATTALATLDPQGREKAILAGANVLMPNLSPVSVRDQYQLYDHKLCSGEEAAEGRRYLEERIRKIGYEIVTDRGDAIMR